MKSGERVLVTGSGGLAGVNFVRALRASKRGYYIVGTDFNKYHLVYPDLDSRYLTPRHTDREFLPRVASIVKQERIDFLHPQPSSEAYVISVERRRIGCRVFLPDPGVMKVGQDKLLSQQALARKGYPVAKTTRHLVVRRPSPTPSPRSARPSGSGRGTVRGGGSAFSARTARRPSTGWSSGSGRARDRASS